MDFHIKQLLERAQKAKRFEHADCRALELWVYCNQKDKKVKVQENSENLMGKDALTQWLERKAPGHPEAEAPRLAGFDVLGGLRLLIQSSGHKQHGFGNPDKLPFKDLDTFRQVEKTLSLPEAYVLALDHGKGVIEYCPIDSELSCTKLDFIAQNIMYNYDAWSLAVSHNPETGMTTGFLRADGQTDEEALIKHLRKPERAIDVDGMVKKSEKLGRQLDVDIALEYLNSSEPCTNVDAVVRTLKGFGRKWDVHSIIQYFQACGFQIALDAQSNGSDRSDSGIDVDAMIRCQKSLGLHHDLDIISRQLDVFRPKIDVEAILSHLIASEEQVLHPMLLPAIMYKSLRVSSEGHLKALHRDIVDLERVLRHVKVRSEAVPGDGPVEDQEMHDEQLDYQSLSRRLNSCKKDQASRDGRHHFRKQFQTHLEKAAKGVKEASAGSPVNTLAMERSSRILKAGHNLEQWISFNTRIFEFEEGRDVNHRARIEAQLDLLYSLISQRQRRTQEQIVQSTREDSGDMKYLAYLGSFFLPANLMAAIFGVKGWQMSVGDFFVFFFATILLIGLVTISMRCRAWLNSRSEQLKANKTRFFGFGPTSDTSSAGKPDSLNWESVERPRSISMSSIGRC